MGESCFFREAASVPLRAVGEGPGFTFQPSLSGFLAQWERWKWGGSCCSLFPRGNVQSAVLILFFWLCSA